MLFRIGINLGDMIIDGASGTHIWADRYDGILEDIFDLQDEVTTAIVAAVAPQSRQGEHRGCQAGLPEQ